MRTKFRGYYRIHKEDLLATFADCLFVFDASALLDIFRLNKELTEQVFVVMENYSKQIRIPYHAAEEYNNRINDVLTDQYHKIEDAKKSFKKFEQSLQAKRNQPYISTTTAELINTLKVQIETDFDSQAEYIFNEILSGNLQNKMADLLNNRVLEPFSVEEIQKFEKQGQERFSNKIPPGWKDSTKKSNRFGDYVNWEEILRLAENEKKNIIFITNDAKNDWIEEINGKKIGPLNALSQEFCKRVNNDKQLFYIYTLDGFLGFTQKHKENPEFSIETIESVKNILEESAADEAGLNSKLNMEAKKTEPEKKSEVSKVPQKGSWK